MSFSFHRGTTTHSQRLPLGDKFPAGMSELIERCWSADPEQRPTFAQIVPQLHSIVKEYAM